MTTQVRPPDGLSDDRAKVSVICAAISAFWSSESTPSMTRQLTYGAPSSSRPRTARTSADPSAASARTHEQLDAIADRSQEIRAERYPQITWEHTHVVRTSQGMKAFCLYDSPDADSGQTARRRARACPRRLLPGRDRTLPATRAGAALAWKARLPFAASSVEIAGSLDQLTWTV